LSECLEGAVFPRFNFLKIKIYKFKKLKKTFLVDYKIQKNVLLLLHFWQMKLMLCLKN